MKIALCIAGICAAFFLGYRSGSHHKEQDFRAIGLWTQIESATFSRMNLKLLENKKEVAKLNESAFLSSLSLIEELTSERIEEDMEEYLQISFMKEDWRIPFLIEESRQDLDTIEFTSPERKSKAIDLINKIESNQAGDDNSE
jgi:hypothetical protein